MATTSASHNEMEDSSCPRARSHCAVCPVAALAQDFCSWRVGLCLGKAGVGWAAARFSFFAERWGHCQIY